MHVLVWSKSDQRRLRKTLHKQTDRQTNRQTDTTKIMVTWPWTNNAIGYVPSFCVDYVMFSRNSAIQTKPCSQSLMQRIIHRDSPGGTTKLCTQRQNLAIFFCCSFILHSLHGEWNLHYIYEHLNYTDEKQAIDTQRDRQTAASTVIMVKHNELTSLVPVPICSRRTSSFPAPFLLAVSPTQTHGKQLCPTEFVINHAVTVYKSTFEWLKTVVY